MHNRLIQSEYQLHLRTNHIFKTRDKEYFGANTVDVYDYPINDAPTETILETNKATVPTVNGFVTLNVGYTNVSDIPTELIDCALRC